MDNNNNNNKAVVNGVFNFNSNLNSNFNSNFNSVSNNIVKSINKNNSNFNNDVNSIVLKGHIKLKNLDINQKPELNQRQILKERTTVQDMNTINRRVHNNVNIPTLQELMNNCNIKEGEGDLRQNTPYITADLLPVNWLETMKRIGSRGLGATSIMKELQLTKAQFETLLSTSPEFAEAYERTLILCGDTMEKIAVDMCTGDIKGNGDVLKFIMLNRFGWQTANKVQEITSNNVNTNTLTATVQQNTTIENKELSEKELKAELEKRGLNIDLMFKKSYE